MFDVLLLGFYYFGVYVILLLLIIKLFILLNYRPKDLNYAGKRLLIYHHKYVVRSEDYVRWRHYRNLLNSFTIGIHGSIIFWLLCICLHGIGAH